MSMSTGLSGQARERLSRLVDGEGTPEELQQVMADGREDPQEWSGTLESWHAYHLIGDVMRSEELAGSGRDNAFLAGLRERLAEEPVVVAPQPRVSGEVPSAAVQVAGSASVAGRRHRWRAPLAAAAGVVMVAGVAVMTGLPGRQGSPQPAGATLVQAPPAGLSVAMTPAPAAEQRVLTANGPLLRDARLDQYLSAHKQFGGSSALGVPSGFLRSATYEGPSH